MIHTKIFYIPFYTRLTVIILTTVNLVIYNTIRKFHKKGERFVTTVTTIFLLFNYILYLLRIYIHFI